MIRRWLTVLVSDRVRELQRALDVEERMCTRQTRRISELLRKHHLDQQQLDYHKTELLRVVTERFETNAALTEANNEIVRLEKELDAARRAYDVDERRAARYRLAWVSCRQTRTQMRTEIEKAMHQ